ncbi:MAG: Helicase superfamily 1 UvrD-related protein [Firmicutes bacterium]|nr:Helicase superfamily 1 UvrD-related protein [Bacillota bacterium]
MTTKHPDFEIEENHLANTLSQMKPKKIDDIARAVPNPYFGRVDFREDGTEEFESFRIGRCKVAKLHIVDTEDILVFDWRDPVSTLFYEGYGGRASYEVLGRYKYEGTIRLKRQYKIEDSVLKSMVDNYIMDQILARQEDALFADPLLVERLRQGASDKLKDIVTSIQAEQNRIIREPINQVTVIQGVAGSGKTTIGLHRLSYLLYNEKLNPKKLIVVAPNRIFLDYISDLLPDIDAADVEQMVWDDVVAAITRIPLTIRDNQLIRLLLEGGDKDEIRLWEDIAQFKGSLAFTKVLSAYLEQKIKKFCLKLGDISLFDHQLTITIQEQLDKIWEDNKAPYNERIRLLTHYITFRITNFIEVIEARQSKKGPKQKHEIYRTEAENFLEKHFKNWKAIHLLDAYREVFSSKTAFTCVKDKKYDFDAIREHSLDILAAGEVEREDLAPLAYLSYLIDGWMHVAKYDHIVVDEAQDLNAFEFSILKQLSTNGSFTIMGDLSQGIHSYRSISSWNALLQEVFADSRTAYREITYSYRSAKEIIDVANRVMPKGHTQAVPVYEIGRKPTVEKIISPEYGTTRIIERLKAFLQLGATSIGVITKNEQEAATLHEQLTAIHASDCIGQTIYLVSGTLTAYQGGISVLPVMLAKGLEFDGVIIWNASEDQFTAEAMDAKLLYVALTRAMHSLHIMYQGNLTPLLKKAKP